MMTFYLGKEIKLYEERFEEIKKHYKAELESGSNSETFRHVVDLLYSAIIKKNNDKKVA